MVVLSHPALLALLLPALLAAAAPAEASAARVELAASEGAWNGLSCVDPAGAPSAALWTPPGARVQAVFLAEGANRTAAPWRAEGPAGLRVETEGASGEACAAFDIAAGMLVRYVAPADVSALSLRVTPPEGRALVVPGHDVSRDPSDPRVHHAVLGPLAAGASVPLRVVDEGRVGELSLLATLGGLSVAILGAALLWHALRPPLGGKPAERFMEHLAELQARIMPPALAFALLNVAFFASGLRIVHVADVPLPVPTLGVEGSVSARAFDAFAERMVPGGVTLVALRPADAVLAQVQTGLFLAFAAVLPLLLYEIAAFLGPGLEPRERRAILLLLPVLAGLFLAGALFAFLFMAPFLIATLYGYAPGVGALPLLGVGDLVSFALVVVLAFGLAFELPVAMYGLARAGVVAPGTFLRYLRHAVLVIVLAAGVLTPDPSVVSQLLVAGPVVGLYLLGVGAAFLGARRRAAPSA